MNWKFFVRMAIPMIENAGEMYCDKDDDTAGRDDMIGQSLLYVAKLLTAIMADKELPKAPAILK